MYYTRTFTKARTLIYTVRLLEYNVLINCLMYLPNLILKTAIPVIFNHYIHFTKYNSF